MKKLCLVLIVLLHIELQKISEKALKIEKLEIWV